MNSKIKEKEPTYRIVKRWANTAIEYKIMRINVPKQEAIDYVNTMTLKNKNPKMSYVMSEDWQ